MGDFTFKLDSTVQTGDHCAKGGAEEHTKTNDCTDIWNRGQWSVCQRVRRVVGGGDLEILSQWYYVVVK